MADLKALAENIVGLTLKEAAELSKILEDDYGIEPAKGGGMMMAAPSEGAAEVEQTEFDLVLTAIGDQKIKVIKAVREITSLGLKEAKGLVDATPKAILEKKSQEEVDIGKSKLEEAGANCEIK